MTVERDPVLGKAIEQALPQASPPYGAKQRVKRALDRRGRSAEKPWVLVVAAGCLATVVAALVLVKGFGSSAPLAVHGSALTLDGVRVVLRSKAEVTVDRDGPAGTVLRLSSGTVFLKVRKGHPTTVLAGNTRVEVIGTLFGVARSTAGVVNVGVVEGVVRVTDGAAGVTLHAGERSPPGAEAPHPTPSELSLLEEPPPRSSANEVTTPAGSSSAVEGPAHETVAPSIGSSASPSANPPGTPVAERAQVDGGAGARRPGAKADSNAYLRARELERHDDVRAALDAYASIAKGTSANAEDALFAMTRLAARSGDPREALTRAAEYRERFPDGRYARDIDVIVLNARLTLGDRAAAAKEADRFLGRFPTDPRAWRFHLARAEHALESRDCATVKVELMDVPDGEQKRKIAAACRMTLP